MAFLTLPGLIDPHVHLRDPNQTQKEDFYTGTCAALAGGYTTILDMPNNKIPITTLERLEEKINSAKEKIVCDVGFYFGSLGDNLSEFEKVNPPAGGNVRGLKLYLNETTGNFLIDREKLEKIFKAWTHASSLARGDLARLTPILLHAEDDAVEHVIELVGKLRTNVHFCHISTESDLKQIIKAKEKGLPISCSVTPHHLFLNEHDAETLGPYGKMKPPLKPQQDVDFLWKHLNAIDVIESDHAPHTRWEKENPLPPFGVSGLETTLPLLLTAASQNRIVIEDIIRLCFENPSKIFGIKTDQKTRVEVNLSSSYTIENKNLFTKCKWSPFDGMKVKGKIQTVYIRDTKVFENNTVLVQPGFGKIV